MEEQEQKIVYKYVQECLQWLCNPRGGNNFFGRILNGCQKCPSDSLKFVAAVSITDKGKYQLKWNPEIFNAMDRPLQIMILVHEAAHLTLSHIPRMLFILNRIPEQDLYRRKFMWETLNIAADMAANDVALRPMIDSYGTRFNEYEKVVIFPESRGYPGNKTFEDYVARLLEDLEREGHDDHLQPGILMSPVNVPQWFEDMVKNESMPQTDAQEMTEGKSSSEVERMIVRSKEETKHIVNSAVQQTSKSRGTVPHYLKSYIDTLLQKASIPWKEVLKNMVTSGIANKVEESTVIPNPSYFHLEAEGIEPYPGYQFEYSINVAIGVDTSGSVSDDEFTMFMSEIQTILAHHDNVKIRLVMFDAKIQREEEFENNLSQNGRALLNRYGGGGTSFTPFLKYCNGVDEADDWEPNAEKCSARMRDIDLSLLFTDGYAPVGPPYGPLPDAKPNHPLIWVLTPGGKISDAMRPRVLEITR